jgi:hypothetical protein
MTTEHDDDGLREQFQRLRRQDERLARPFSVPRPARQATRQPLARQSEKLRHRLAAALAAAALGLVLAAGMGMLHWLRPRAAALPAADAIARLSGWRAPTDWLLQASGDQLLRGVPRLGAPLLGGTGITTTKTHFSGGDERR